MTLGLDLSLSIGRGGPSGVAIDDTITLANGAWMWGSSSPAGNQDGTGVTIFTATSALIDASYATANETISSVTAPKYTMTNGKILHNRAISGRKTTEIATDEANCAASVGASDFKFLHQGDNQDVGVTDVQFVDSVMTQFAAGRTSLSISLPATNFIHLVNTYGGMNAGRTDSAEKIGDKTTGKKEIIYRKLNALQQGAVASFYWTLQDHAADYGYQDATNDPIDISKGISPRGFMLNDGSHMNQHGYNVMAQYLFGPILAAVNGGCAFVTPHQFLSAATPATPAAGDSIGTLGFFGTGSTFSLAATNTQTDYTVNSTTGAITRIGATPPTRDFTQVHIQTSKSGKTSRVQKQVWVGERAKSGTSSLVRFDGYGVIGHVASDWSVAATLTVIFRIRGAAGADGVSQTVFAQAGSTGGVTVTRNASNQIDVLFRKGGNTSVLSMTSASNTFRNADGQKWVMASIDIPSGLAKCTTFAVPGTATTITNSAGANTALLADNTATITMTNQHGFAAVGSGPTFSQLASARGSFDIGDFWMGAVYLDPTVQANRELFVDSGGSPLPALLATSDGVVSGTSPLLYCRGNATDWRLCNFIPSTVQMHFGNYLNPGTSERGYLTNV